MSLLRRSKLDPALLVVLVLLLPALWTFAKYPSLPRATDAELHIFRLVELSHLLRQGEFYPRWAPHFYFGYGYPIFNYYAPLTYYLGFLLEILPLVGAVGAMKGLFMLTIVGAGGFMFLFVNDVWGREAGVIAAVSYVYAPYLQLIDPHIRGVSAEFLSFAMFPLALWQLNRLRTRPSRWNWVASVAAVAAIVLAHNLMALVFGGILGLWWLFGGRWSWAVGAALVVGFALAGFFWLPLGLERDAVNLNTLIDGGSHYDFREHFLTLRQLLSPSLRLDWGASEPLYRFNLGVGQWMLALLGLLSFGWTRRRETAFFGVMALLLIGLMMGMSEQLWERVPLLPFLQFPWRLLGPAAAMLAILAGIGVSWWKDSLVDAFGFGRNLTLVAPLLLVALALPRTQIAPWQPFGTATTLDALYLETQGYWLGTTSTADFVPATVETQPRVEQTLYDAFYAGTPLERVNRATLPAGTTVASEVVSPLHLRYRINSAESFPLRLFLFAFPGWEATVDDQPVTYEIGKPEGFIVVPVPAGEHTVDVRFGSTPARQWGWAISVSALLLTVAGALFIPTKPAEAVDAPRPLVGRWLLAGLLLFALHVFVLEPTQLLHMNSIGNSAEPAQNDLFADFDSDIALIGFDAPRRRLRPGDSFDITLYWRAQRPLEDNVQVFVHVLQPDGTILGDAQSDKLNPADFPTERWPTNRYVRDRHTITLPADTPAGAYTITAGLWRRDDGRRLYVFDSSRTFVGDFQPLTTIAVSP